MKNSLITWNEAIEILKTLPPDDNGIINLWKQFGIKPCNAYDSQVLLEIYSELCENKKCLNCPIGKVLLKWKDFWIKSFFSSKCNLLASANGGPES